MKRKRTNVTGFTLIELLVVIAVIALMAAILFPVFAQAREKARQTTCLAQAKQCGMAIGMYEQDYDEVVTPCFMYYRFSASWNGREAILYMWEDLVQPYVKNSNVFVCPSRSGTWTFGRSTFPPGEGAGRQVLRYSMACNDWVANRSGFWGPDYQHEALGPMEGIMGIGRPVTIHVANIEEPANTLLLADATWIEFAFARCYQDWLPDNQRPYRQYKERNDPDWGLARGVVNLRHNGGFTAIFADNHAKWLTRTTGPDMWSIRKGVRLVGGNDCEDLVK